MTFTVINKYDKGAVVQIATVFEPIWHVVCRRVLKHVVLDIYVTTFFAALNCGNTSAMTVILFYKISRI